MTQQRAESSWAGSAYATFAYLWWGAMPLFFVLFTMMHPVDLLAYRILFSFVFCLILIALWRGWGRFRDALFNPRIHGLLMIAGLLIATNWGLYIYATISGQVLATSLGYFINPLASIVLGVVLLGEKLRPVQWVAVGVSTLAVVVLTMDYGSLPWISLGLAACFGLYGLVKNKVGAKVDSITGLAIENSSLSVLAIAWMIAATLGLFPNAEGLNILGHMETWRSWALTASGVITVVPLVLFAMAASRLPLSLVGMFQYLTPIMQFLLGYFVFHEDMTVGRWVGFSLVWVAVLLLIIDAVIKHLRVRGAHRAARRTAG